MKEKTRAFYKAVFKYWWNERVLKFFRKQELVHMKKCSLCGEKALEGIEICPECLKKAAVDPRQIKRLRQISNILSITADTDTNIKACMQSITEIADDLERGSYGKEEKKQESNTIPTGKDIDI